MAVLRLADVRRDPLQSLLCRYGLVLTMEPPASPIPGTYWGEPEAGLVENRLHARTDTPLHSVLHEACHYICMPPQRRVGLHTNASGDYAEENAVCYLQILLADLIPEMGRERMFSDMDAWGYSFRLGSATRWFHEDAADARAWLQARALVSARGEPVMPKAHGRA